MRSELVKICALSVVCVIVCIVSRTVSGTISAAVRIAGITIVFFGVILMLTDVISDVRAMVDGFSGYAQIADYWAAMLKALGIAFLCRICTDVCRDCGESAIAGCVEIAGKLAVLAICMPMISDVIVWAQELMSRV